MRYPSAATSPVQQLLPLRIFVAAMVAFEGRLSRLRKDQLPLEVEKCLMHQRRPLVCISEYKRYNGALNWALTVSMFGVVTL